VPHTRQSLGHARTARARRARCFDDVVPDFRMRLSNPAIDLPSNTTPAPMPVPMVTQIRRALPFPDPQIASPRTAASASFSIATGRRNSADSFLTGLPPSHPGKVFTSPNAPVSGSTGPVHPIPIPWSSTPDWLVLWASISITRCMAWSNPRGTSVGHSAFARTRPFPSTTPNRNLCAPDVNSPDHVYSLYWDLAKHWASVTSTLRLPLHRAASPNPTVSHAMRPAVRRLALHAE